MTNRKGVKGLVNYPLHRFKKFYSTDFNYICPKLEIGTRNTFCCRKLNLELTCTSNELDIFSNSTSKNQ